MDKLKRRDFLKTAALAGTADFWSGQPARAEVDADYDVVIIGAGMAGMTAGRLLSSTAPGLKLLILEARDRVAQEVAGALRGDTHTRQQAIIGPLQAARRRD